MLGVPSMRCYVHYVQKLDRGQFVNVRFQQKQSLHNIVMARCFGCECGCDPALVGYRVKGVYWRTVGLGLGS